MYTKNTIQTQKGINTHISGKTENSNQKPKITKERQTQQLYTRVTTKTNKIIIYKAEC